MKKAFNAVLAKVLMLALILQCGIVGQITSYAEDDGPIRYIMNENFTGDEWIVNKSLKDADYATRPTKYGYAYANASGSVGDMKVVERDGKKVLQIEQTAPTSTTYPQTSIFKTTELTDEFVFEARISLVKGTSAETRFTLFNNSNFCLGPQMFATNAYVDKTYNFPNGTSPGTSSFMSKVIFPTDATNGTMSNWYDVKEVWRKNADGKFIYDLYVKKDVTSAAWEFQGTMYPKVTADLFSSITKVQLGIMNSTVGAAVAKTQVDFIKIYQIVPTVVTSSTITNAQTNVSTDTASIDITFNHPMDVTTLNASNIQLYDETTSSNINYVGSYNETTKTYSIPTSSILEQDGVYSIKFINNNIKNMEGYTLSTTNDIRFTTGNGFGFNSTCSITNGASNVNIDIGKLSLTFEKALEKTTVNTQNVILLDKNDAVVAGGYVLEMDETDATKCNLYFGQLAYSNTYKLIVKSSVMAEDSTYASPKIFAFATANYSTNIDFEDNTKWPVDGAVADIDLDYTPRAMVTAQYENGSSGNKVLKVTASADSRTDLGSKAVTTINDTVSAEIYIRPQYITGNDGNNFLTFKGTRNGVAGYQNDVLINTLRVYLDSANKSSFNLLSTYDKNKYYGFKLVGYKNQNGLYIFDAYMDNSGNIGGNNWNLVGTGLELASSDKMLDKITHVTSTLAKYAGNTVCVDNFKITQLIAPKVTYSNMKQGATVPPSLSLINVKFSDAMRENTVTNSNITLVRASDNHIVATTGTYDAVTRTYEMTLTEAMDKGEAYTIKFNSAIQSQVGMAMQTGNDITFSTESADVIVDDVKLTETANSDDVFTNLTGKTSAYAKVTVKKNVSENKMVTIIVALFDDNNTLQNIGFESRSLTQTTTTINDIGLSSISPQANWNVKVFVWDDINDMQPISKDVLTISAK